MTKDLNDQTKKAQDTKVQTQNAVLAQTTAALKGRTVEKKIHDLGAGYSEVVYKIVGSETVAFKFHMSEYEKTANALTILITVKNMRSEKVMSENFADDKFIKRMLGLFKNKERQMLQKEKNKQWTQFVKQLKTYLK